MRSGGCTSHKLPQPCARLAQACHSPRLVEKEPEAASVEDLAEDALLNALPDDQDELTEMIAAAPDILRGLL